VCTSRRDGESGVALIAVLLLLMLVGALAAEFYAVTVSERRLQGVDRDRTNAFYAAHGGLEKLTADISKLFFDNYAPTGNQIRALTTTPPALPGVTWVTTGEGPGYTVTFTPVDANANPGAEVRGITSGTYNGFTGLVTTYTMSVTAQTGSVGEVRLQRKMEAVQIPLFQFGQFSDTDIAFHPADDFDFGGRIHTNGNLFLAAGTTLTISDKVTVVGEVIRTNNPNGQPISAGSWTGNVRLLTAPGSYRNMATTEGSLVGTLGSAANDGKSGRTNWTNTSQTIYHSNIINHLTGAVRLDLPVVAAGYQPIDLIRRPPPGEGTTSDMYNQRYFSMASLRILLSDTAADITNLPGVTGTAPLSLDTAVGGGYAVSLANGRPPLAIAETPVGSTVSTAGAAGATVIKVVSLANFNSGAANSVIVAGTTLVACTGTGTSAGGGGPRLTGCTGTPSVPALAAGATVTVDHGYRVPAGTGLNGGFIKIEEQTGPGVWQDRTLEILNLGFAGKQSSPTNCTSTAEPSPNAVIRIERVKDLSSCITGSSDARLTDGANYWPKALYDPREGVYRAVATSDTTIRPGGVMHYVELDVNNLRRWFLGQIGASGPAALNTTGYTVYFSDRRNNRNAANQETGEYGFEDFVNPASSTGAPNGALDTGEDVNGNGTLDTYGATPKGPAVTWIAPLDDTVRPYTVNAGITATVAQSNPTRFFRHALKLVGGKLSTGTNLGPPSPGLAVASENPVYVQGDYNANGAFNDPHVACSVLADAITLLSNGWSDLISWNNPHNDASRPASNTWYRFAAFSGKGLFFPWPSAGSPPVNFGSDGGTHNFLRLLEDWTNKTVSYRGSMASMFYSRQAVGTFKDIPNVYEPPDRDFAFDTDFRTPALLPPRTPMFRDVNTTGFTQILTPPR